MLWQNALKWWSLLVPVSKESVTDHRLLFFESVLSGGGGGAGWEA